MKLFSSLGTSLFTITAVIFLIVRPAFPAEGPALHRRVAEKQVYETLPEYLNQDRIVFKLQEGLQPAGFDGQSFPGTGAEWDRLNAVVASRRWSLGTRRHFKADLIALNRLRAVGSQRVGKQLPDLSLYYEIDIAPDASERERLEMISELNSLDIIEIAYFPSRVELAMASEPATPDWEANQFYLQAAPAGINAYYAWGAAGGKGEGIKVIDIEGNWVESHEDLHGGTDHFHIAGARIEDPDWYHHGTAVLGEIAADSNGFGMTGIAYNVDLGTVSIGSMSTANALITAANNSDTGDIVLIELQMYGPHNGGYVPVEYEQATFDAILQLSSAGWIVVEAGANGAENLDDTTWYGRLFDPSYRFSGAIMVAASDGDHRPASFTNYGQRLDVHAYGTWNVYTLGYGDLYGTDTTDYYTADFAGTSSASPIITGACACLQGINRAIHGRTLDHTEMRALLQDFSTPQAVSSKHIGPMPDLQGSADCVVGVAFVADTTVGWVPFDVNFTGSSGLPVDNWLWDFGDGASDTTQSPSHTYTTPGLQTVSLQVSAGGDVRTAVRPNYIVALADSLIGRDTAGQRGTRISVPVYARNTVPIEIFKIPVEVPGTLNLGFDSFSTVGCRTEYFEAQNFLHWDVSHKRVTIKLQSSTSGTSPDLVPGTGPIVNLHFTIPFAASFSDTATISLSGYDMHLPGFYGYGLVYEPVGAASTVSVCLQRGNVDGLPGITVADLTFFVAYLFEGGPAPVPLALTDVDCSGDVNIADLVRLVDYLFAGGPPPCPC